MKPSLFLFLFLGLCPLAVAEPLLIEKPGEYSFGEKEKISVEEKDGRLLLRRLNTNGGVALRAVAGWKIYSQAGNLLWVYDGEALLIRMEFKADGIAFQDSSHSFHLWREAPKAFVETLPKNKWRPLTTQPFSGTTSKTPPPAPR